MSVLIVIMVMTGKRGKSNNTTNHNHKHNHPNNNNKKNNNSHHTILFTNNIDIDITRKAYRWSRALAWNRNGEGNSPPRNPPSEAEKTPCFAGGLPSMKPSTSKLSPAKAPSKQFRMV